MSGSPWLGVLFIGGAFGGVLLLLLAAILLLVGGGVLWAVAISFAGLLNSPKTSTAETGTPA